MIDEEDLPEGCTELTEEEILELDELSTVFNQEVRYEDQ